MNFKIPEALQKVRIDFLLKEGFLGHFMSYRPDDFSDQVPSAGTDGNKTLWNPVWFDSLTSAEKEGVKRHETKHDLYEHSLRLSERPDFYTNRRQANVAMDVISQNKGENLTFGTNRTVHKRNGKKIEVMPIGIKGN